MRNRHFHRGLDKIKKMILSLGAMVEDRVHRLDNCIATINSEEATQIIQSDFEIDEMEVEIEEESLKSIALYQPVAADLRFLIAVIKINNELERIGDQAVNVAQRVLTVSRQKRCEIDYNYSVLASKAEQMLRMSLDSLVNMDIDLAVKTCLVDDDVDKIKNEAYDFFKSVMKQNPDYLGFLINMYLISRHLERLADHTTNIAEEVIYMIEGEIVRHSGTIK